MPLRRLNCLNGSSGDTGARHAAVAISPSQRPDGHGQCSIFGLPAWLDASIEYNSQGARVPQPPLAERLAVHRVHVRYESAEPAELDKAIFLVVLTKEIDALKLVDSFE